MKTIQLDNDKLESILNRFNTKFRTEIMKVKN